MANRRGGKELSELRFLVVEDHGFQRWALGNMLESMGARYLFAAPDGQSALELIRDLEDPIDIVVSDLDMPAMDGMAFIRHLAAECPATSLLIVSSLERSLIASVEGMACAYGARLLGAMQKPPTPKKLLALIDRHYEVKSARATAGDAPYDAQEIRRGLEDGQFTAFYQPKVEMATGRVHSAEALARWIHTRDGVVHPGAFIPQIEAAGLVGVLTDMMVVQAAASCRGWIERGLDLSVAVNLSLASLADLELADRMTSLVSAAGLEPRRMTFEITETADHAELGRALENLSRLRMKGFGLSIDDFGTGYSSLQRLAQFPFTELKIDRSFLKDAASHPPRRAALESSLEMANKLRIVAVAEGVEIVEEWELLRALQCPLAQGYFLARPMPAGEFRHWVAQR